MDSEANSYWNSFVTQRWTPGTRRLYVFMRCFPLTALPQGAGLSRFMFMVCQGGPGSGESDGEQRRKNNGTILK